MLVSYDAAMNINWQPLQALLDQHQRFVITSHIRPDADAIGSEIGLAMTLAGLGKSAKIINVSPTPAHLKFLDPDDVIRQLGVTASNADVLEADAIIVVDTSAWGQLSDIGKVFRESSQPRIVIDHHVSADDLGALEFKDTTRESTGSLIYELATFLNVPLPTSAAVALFAAMATDTGWFRFPATSSETLRVVSELLALGVQPHVVYRQLYEQGSLAGLHLQGRALGRMQIDCQGKLAYTTVPWSDFVELGANASDTENLVNEGLTIAGVVAAFIAIEQPNRQVKVSFRSRTDVNVAVVAEQFGGGGHKQAAGATLPGPFATAVEQALSAMRKGLAEQLQ